MPEYVYALHDFSPEHEDEIPFKAGDRIEVIEKDDLYGDGWWQVSNKFCCMCRSLLSPMLACVSPSVGDMQWAALIIALGITCFYGYT